MAAATPCIPNDAQTEYMSVTPTAFLTLSALSLQLIPVDFDLRCDTLAWENSAFE